MHHVVDGTYGAEDLVTRRMYATILARLEASGLGDASILASALDAYADADEVSKFAVESVEWAVENGIIGVCAGRGFHVRHLPPEGRAGLRGARSRIP